jgi:DNA (cytosine-5)-methyltransferase 1
MAGRDAMRPRILDLFCGAGGAAMGYHRAGFDVQGVDNRPQRNYPFPIERADALAYLDGLSWGELVSFSAIHASPPCQLYSVAAHNRRAAGVDYPDLIAPTRAALEATGLPWIMENVPGSPLRPDFVLCGCMFNLPLLQRERWFETSWAGFDLRPRCYHATPALSVTGDGTGSGNGQRERVTRALGRPPQIADARAAMGIDWMSGAEMALAIPPAYTEHLAPYLLAEVARKRAAGTEAVA